MRGLKNKIALVTGSSRGIGRAIALRLAQEGCHVIVNYRFSEEAARSVVQQIEALGVEALAVQADVSLPGETQHMAEEILERFESIHILVNNAGITRDGTMHNMNFENWDKVIQTNLSSCFNMSKAVIDGMRERGFGRIVSIGSINGRAGQYGQVNYAAAKAGIHGFTKALALEGASRGITVNAIAPGYVLTDMVRSVPEKVLERIVSTIPVKHLGDPNDIARAVVFLVSDDAGFITGSTLDINGGQHMY